MIQPEIVHAAAEAAGSEKLNPGETIIGHVANSPVDHPLFHLPTIWGIDMSVTKHVLMLWIVAALLLIVVTLAVRRYARQGTMIPSGPLVGLIEYVTVRVRDEIVAPAVGDKWVDTYTPLILLFFLFIVSANAIGLIPIFDPQLCCGRSSDAADARAVWILVCSEKDALPHRTHIVRRGALHVHGQRRRLVPSPPSQFSNGRRDAGLRAALGDREKPALLVR